uniref:Uncharacterized protein n=1 Tax=Arundo donax TaxID=35708 RepID=A0A0A9B7X1_ARUDO
MVVSLKSLEWHLRRKSRVAEVQRAETTNQYTQKGK